MKLAKTAMRLRDEQLRARIVYVEPQNETNAELDAITARVVAQLQELQQAGMGARTPSDPQKVEIQLIRALRELLEKMLSARREHFLRHKIELVQRRIANLYFSSEITTTGGDPFTSTFHHADEALLAALQRHSAGIRADLERFHFSDETSRMIALSRLQRMEKKLASDVLARTRPELERLLVTYRDVLLVFLMRDFRETLGEFAWEVVQQSQLARGHQLSYKILASQFPRFREVFESKFMDRLLSNLQAPLAQRIEEEGSLREETVRFAADPRIYAEICAVMCNAIYDYLHGEGFLDLPVQWQQQLYDEE